MEASAGRDDRRLLAAAAGGDPDAAEEICRRHRPAVYRAALRIVRTEHDADDVAQSTLVRALAALRRRPPRELQPWLLAIARNESLSLLRARPDDRALSDGADGHGSLEDSVAARDEARRVLSDVGALPPRQRDALVLRELHGLPYSRVGGALGISSGAARQAVFQARASLRRLRQALAGPLSWLSSGPWSSARAPGIIVAVIALAAGGARLAPRTGGAAPHDMRPPATARPAAASPGAPASRHAVRQARSHPAAARARPAGGVRPASARPHPIRAGAVASRGADGNAAAAVQHGTEAPDAGAAGPGRATQGARVLGQGAELHEDGAPSAGVYEDSPGSGRVEYPDTPNSVQGPDVGDGSVEVPGGP